MTTKRTYLCNMCGLLITKGEGYGVHFNSGTIDLKNMFSCENHICKDCLTQLIAAVNYDKLLVSDTGNESEL